MKLVKKATDVVGKLGKSAVDGVGTIAGGVVKAGKKVVTTNPFALVGDHFSAAARNDVDSLFKEKKMLMKFYGTIKKDNKKEMTYSDVIVFSYHMRNGFEVNFVVKSLILQKMVIDVEIKLADIKSLQFDKQDNSLKIITESRKGDMIFIFASALNRGEFALELLNKAIENEIEIQFDMTMEDLIEFVAKERNRLNADGRLHLVSKEDEEVLRKMIAKHRKELEQQHSGSTMDLEELQKKLEVEIVANEDQLYKNYLEGQKIGDDVVGLFDEVDKALAELEAFTNKLDVDVETIRPGVELIQYNNNRLEVVHTNQTKFIDCMEEFINCLLIDPISLHTIRTCQNQLEKAENLKKICESATVVAVAASYSPPEGMQNMVALIQEQEYDQGVLKDFSLMLSNILQNKLKVEMDFLKIDKIIDIGANLIKKEKKPKETLEGAHNTLRPFGDLIAWLKLYANEEFLKVRNSYIGKMTKVANEYFTGLIESAKKSIRPISKTHEETLSYAKFNGPKIDELKTFDIKMFTDCDHKKDKIENKLPMYEVVRETMETIAFNARAEFKFLVEIFQMEENGKNGINCLIDDVYKQAFESLEKLIEIIETNDPFLLLRIVHTCKLADIEIELATNDMTKFTKMKKEKKDEEEEEEKFEQDEETQKKQQKMLLKKAQINRQHGARSLLDLQRKKKVTFEWLGHFYDVICSMCLKKFSSFIDKQIDIIKPTVIIPKKHGVTVHFKRMQYFLYYLQRAVGCVDGVEHEIWGVLDDSVQPMITKLIRSMFDWLKNVKDTQIDQKPTMTLRFQNFYHFQDTISDRVVKCVKPFIEESRNEYALAIRNLSYHHLNLHFGKFFEFFDHIGRLIPSMKRADEIAYQQAYNKQKCAKICKLVVRNQLVKAIEYICRSIKHHIVKQDHRNEAWRVVSGFIKERYTQAEKNCESVYHHKFDVASGEELDQIFLDAFNKTYKRDENGNFIEDSSMMSETTFEDF